MKSDTNEVSNRLHQHHNGILIGTYTHPTH